MDKKSENKNNSKKDLKAVLESKSGRNIHIEKNQAVVGNNTEYTVTNQNGDNTNVKINDDNNSVEVKGAQKDLKEMVEKGDLTGVNKEQNNMSQIQQEAISLVNSSNLSPEEKQAEIAGIQSQDFSEKPAATHQQYLSEVRTKLADKKNKTENEQAQENTKEPNAMEQAFNEVTGAKMGAEEVKGKEDSSNKSTMSPEVMAAYMSKKVMTKK